MKMLCWTAMCLILVANTSAGLAEQEQPKKIEQLPLDDQFLVKAVVSNNAAIRLAELAESRSENEKVKEFAREMLADHKKASEKIGELVKDRKLAVVAGLEKEVRDEIEKLSKLKGNEFDRAFLDAVIRGHEECLMHCKGQTDKGKEAGLQAFARQCHPMLEKHLKASKELRSRLPQ